MSENVIGVLTSGAVGNLAPAAPTGTPASLPTSKAKTEEMTAPVDGPSEEMAAAAEGEAILDSTKAQSSNWLIHLLFSSHEFDECLELIEKLLKETSGMCEYALFVKGLILRMQGDLSGSLNLFRAAAALNPDNVSNLKQIGRALYLLGRFKHAVEAFTEALALAPSDWEVPHNIGLCYTATKEYDKAISFFESTMAIERHSATALQMGRVFTLKEDYRKAVEVYLQALEFSPESPEVLTTLGLLYLRLGPDFEYKAFDSLQSALTVDPSNAKALLAAGSVLQDHEEVELALKKYRAVAVQSPHSPHLWNNIGLCFHRLNRPVAALACLQKAVYLAPLEWIIALNLGLVFFSAQQYASAFLYIGASVNLRPQYAPSYTFLGACLARMGDIENACMSYEKALSMEPGDLLTLFNYVASLHNAGERARAQAMYASLKKAIAASQDAQQEEELSKRLGRVRGWCWRGWGGCLGSGGAESALGGVGAFCSFFWLSLVVVVVGVAAFLSHSSCGKSTVEICGTLGVLSDLCLRSCCLTFVEW